ncbi:predicted protein [Aspergillus terreus NIH2624]|uniref:SP-RING-type domain-containing protein n=1 Tax=Aspergillus terreus (strain NIH 2624 / FGSC A1156) TaxID=341663 RepID=Q0C9S6_ASPTN|nr:uncharacterized protein ATEG_09558 [Aspergillus terreus NIH2624]EAU29749.1 predicted protein [Aspergillus terreus NIH2624]
MTPPLPQSPPSVSHNLVQSSNSTASIFLGGVRRSWMAPTSTTQLPLQPSPPASFSSAPVSVPAPAPDRGSHPLPQHNPTPSRPPEHTRRNAGQLDDQTSPTTTTSPSRQLLSSLNTSVGVSWSDPPRAVPASTPLQHQTAQSVPTAPSTIAYPVSQSMTIPHAPAISTVVRSGPSPSGAPVPSPGTTPTASRPLHAPPVSGADTTVVSSPAPRGTGVPTTTGSLPNTPQPRPVIVNGGHQNPQASYPTPPAQVSAPTRSQSQEGLSSQGVLSIDAAFFEHSLKRLEALGDRLDPQVEQPRTRLLSRACSEQDCLFLAIHQVYCLYSYTPAELGRIPGFSMLQAQGLGVIQQLLVDNSRVTLHFLHWCANFPGTFNILVQNPVYRSAAERAFYCLGLLAERWDPFQHSCLTRGYPPSVEEIEVHLGITSQGLAFTIFLSICRRLPAKREEHELGRIWDQDFHNYQRRLSMPMAQRSAQFQRDNTQFIREYTALPLAPQAEHSPHPDITTPVGPSRNPTMHPSTNSPISPSLLTPSPQVPSRIAAQGSSVPILNHPQPTTAQVPTNVRPQRMQSIPPSTASPYASPYSAMALLPSQLTQTLPHGATPSPVQPSTPVLARNQAGQQPQSRLTSPVFTIPGQTHQHVRVLLLPQGPVPPSNARPNPTRTALHQAHLRGPCNRLISKAEGNEVELFQYLSSFVVAPAPLGQRQCAYKWSFPLSTAAVNRFPTRETRGVGHRPLRTLFDGCQVYRLRCIKVDPSATEVNEGKWSVAETTWPTVCYLFVNNVEVFARRKVHHGRDLPLDITEHLREGENTISMHFIRAPAEFHAMTYALAVEVLDISGLDRAKSLVQTLPAWDSREKIRKRLAANTINDDDLSVVSQDLIVDLVDPFTARIFDVPVRGQFCGHQECFDHETWILTRASKSGKRALKEDWRCPICGQDARPQSLVIDGFLAEVHAELTRTNRLEGARAIQIKPDLSWQLKSESDAQSSSGRTAGNGQGNNTDKRKHPRDGMTVARAPQRPKIEHQSPAGITVPPRQSSEVIELD